MPKRKDIKKILIIGSGPIIIGQAAEFDYAGTQACLSLKEEGYEVVLINSNPATIMTDKEIADKIYIEPITLEFVERIIRKEKPDAILPTLGGQIGLNMAIQLHEAGILQACNVELLGTKLSSIKQAEDRDLFRNLMFELGLSVPESEIVHTLAEAKAFVNKIGYPVIVRPAYTMGGTGGGMCYNDEDLKEIVENGLHYSPVTQCLIEKSIAGYKEIEYEVIRDASDDAIVVCSMENVDPVGIHTGDSIVVAPAQTLSVDEHELLKGIAIKIIKALKIVGGCNVQLALHPKSKQYYVIEVNPRVSRSSALASKATGYPIAKIASKLAVGLQLKEIENPAFDGTYENFEPICDYVVCKIPRFPFDKFEKGNRMLSTQMKATGEVMAIGKTLEEALLKAIRSLEYGVYHLGLPNGEEFELEDIISKIAKASDERLFFIGEALRRFVTVEEIHELTKIDLFFLNKMKHIIEIEQALKENVWNDTYIRKAKKYGFSDKTIAHRFKVSEEEVYAYRKQHQIFPVYQMIDTLAGENTKIIPYYYSTYTTSNDSIRSEKEKVIVLGSGPIRIGQGVEFDYATVHAIKTIKQLGYEAIVINNNPETVSTDFAISDKLYFEPLTCEDVMGIIHHEQPLGVIVQFGGQTAINLAEKLQKNGVTILGTSLEAIDTCENREKFEALLRKLEIPQPLGKTAFDVENALKYAKEIGYPVLVRPSYVLGGRAMQIVNTDEELSKYMASAVKVNPEHPVLIDRYLVGKEVEVDAICDSETVIIPGIMEHIEKAGVHSGDSFAVYPPYTISKSVQEKMQFYTTKIAKALAIKGLINIQYVVVEEDVFVLEVNPRASRTVPFLSKITNIEMTALATKAIFKRCLKEETLQPQTLNGYFVKAPVFSFQKLKDVDISLGPEMKSTGEVMGQDENLEKALYKALVASGVKMNSYGAVLFTIADKDKKEACALAKRFVDLGFEIYATDKTSEYLKKHEIQNTKVGKIGSENSVLNIIHDQVVNIVVNTTSLGSQNSDGFKIRREAVENGVACLTSLDTVSILLKVLESITMNVRVIA